ncbi:putative cation efflux system proteinc [Anaerotignum neopropionicum]|uniref:Putative cation efflux system proteinc n=1 Tax=Anaerotignum neopropionicum TaxID=36847 RepID=A0A136WDJ3_9FIRM|nr:cation diffusion facilitator family transporter [Anaerotignum neopropionicum]KXL52593.1 putative cation efflux system proteinc [Anaerotignum neopropionicum]
MEKGKSRALENEKIVMKVSINSLAVNVALSIGKVLAGIIAGSGAMVSDGIHSASDVFSTLVVMIGYKLSTRESDEKHQYGHERIECVAALLLAGILCATGIVIGYEGLQKIIHSDTLNLAIPGILALVAAIASIAVKEGMYWYTRGAAKKVNSGALMADAWHHRSDAMSSVGSMVGIIGARMGYAICDPLASVIICIFIVKAAYDIFKDAIDKMLDTACDKEITEKMKDVILTQDGVMGIDQMQTRLFGARIYVDVEIVAKGDMTLNEAHTIAEQVHEAIEKNFEDVKHCMVHVNPKTNDFEKLC